MDLNEATRRIAGVLDSWRRGHAWKEGYIDGLCDCPYYGGYTGSVRTQYTNGFQKGGDDRAAWVKRERKQ